LKVLIDNHLKPETRDSVESKAYKERALSRLCSLLLWVFKESRHSSSKDDERSSENIRRNALLVPLCFLPLVSVVCHKILHIDKDKSLLSFLCFTKQHDKRIARPRHSLLGYVADTPSRSQLAAPVDSSEDPDSIQDNPALLWKRFLPNFEKGHHPSPVFCFTKMLPSDGNWKQHSDCPHGRYVSILSHYVHLLLDAVRADYPNKKNMYSLHLDNLVTTLWASCMFPWLATQNAAVPDNGMLNLKNIPFRRDFEQLHCLDIADNQITRYLHDPHDESSSKSSSISGDAYDYAERFSLAFVDEFYELIKRCLHHFLVFCQAKAADPTCPAICSLLAVALLVGVFCWPWLLFSAGPFVSYCLASALLFLSGLLSLFVYFFLWRKAAASQSQTFSEMIRESSDAFFLHRWATVRPLHIFN
jgi:hypothetical protein